jgi:signal transduction histidine kinase
MRTAVYKKYFTSGIDFLRSHPQLWFTAVVGFAILGAFFFVAHRFASIAQDAQEEMINVRVGSILDAFVVFAPDVLHSPDVLRGRMQAIQRQNPTIDEFSILIPEWNGTWKRYITLSGEGEGTNLTEGHITFDLAKSDPENAYTSPVLMQDERFFITTRAILDNASEFVALAVTTQRLSEADQKIAESLRQSTMLLVGVVILIMLLFVRHARIIDYASLYKKQLEVDEMKDSFISMASHELKSPLTVIRGYIEYLKDGVDDAVKRKEYLRRIDLSATELRQLVDDILDVSRIEMGRLRFSPDHVEPEEVLREVEEMFVDSAKSKDLKLVLRVHAEAKGAQIRVDRGRLKQVIINLVSNAVKYTLAGNITIEERCVDGVVELSVRDSGVGMTSEEQQKLFGKFYRVEADETKGVSGTGLGLWITKYITEHMSGSISVESIKGEGSRFVVRFPRYTQES